MLHFIYECMSGCAVLENIKFSFFLYLNLIAKFKAKVYLSQPKNSFFEFLNNVEPNYKR